MPDIVSSLDQRRRDSIATVLMAIAALGAVASFVFALPLVGDAPPEFKLAEAWRLYGYLAFAGLFVLLAIWPRRLPGLWELVIFHKLAMTVTALALGDSQATDASTIALADGSLTVLLIVAYLLSRGDAAWSRFRVAPESG